MKIFLQKLQPGDEEQLIRLANNPALSNDMCTLKVPFGLNDARDLIDRSNVNDDVVRGVVEASEDKLAGVIMLRDFEVCHKQAELSVWIGEEFWGRGYGTASIQEMTKIGFAEKNLNRIYAYCMVRNNASRRILEKSDFKREGLLRERVIKNSVYEDVYLYALLKKDISD